MTIGEVEGGYQPIQDILPTLPDENSYSYPTYKGVKLLTPFTGKIRLGKDFIEDLYIHMGYQKATAYGTLLEFSFDAGKPVSTQNLSASNAKKRGYFKKRFGMGKIIEMIKESFS